jgi:hypothetical protein
MPATLQRQQRSNLRFFFVTLPLRLSERTRPGAKPYTMAMLLAVTVAVA